MAAASATSMQIGSLAWAAIAAGVVVLAAAVAFLVSLAVRRHRPSQAMAGAAGGGQGIRCPECGRVNLSGSLTCLRCGFQLRAPHRQA